LETQLLRFLERFTIGEFEMDEEDEEDGGGGRGGGGGGEPTGGGEVSGGGGIAEEGEFRGGSRLSYSSSSKVCIKTVPRLFGATSGRVVNLLERMDPLGP
jgi:hypothetical protein